MGKRNGPTSDAGSRGVKRKRLNSKGNSIAEFEARSTAKTFLSELPMDILFEIASWLHPMDLLRLAQTSKLFRQFLMSRNNRVIWTQSMKALMNFPPCPDDLAEPRYAYLMFSRHCHECLADEGTTILDQTAASFLRMELRTRLCNRCHSARHKNWEDLPKKVDKALKPLVPNYQHLGQSLYDVETALTMSAQYNRLHSPAEKEAWLKYRTEIRGMVTKHSDLCQKYNEQESCRERPRLIKLQEKRREQVVERLNSLGWAKELDFIGGIQGLIDISVCARSRQEPLLHVPAELNDQDWKELRPRLVARLRPTRKHIVDKGNEAHILNRVESWLIPAYDAFLASHPPQACHPSLLDVSFIPEFRSALCSMPLDQPLPSELKQVAVARLPSYSETWRRERDQELLGILCRSSPYTNQDVSEDTLRLASTVFRCNECHKVITYPSVISHSCNFSSAFCVEVQAPGMKRPRVYKYTGSSFFDNKHPIRIQVENDLVQHIGQTVSSPRHGTRLWRDFRHIVFDEDRYEHMINMLDALQWSRLTLLSEMEEKDPHVQCLCQCFSRTKDHQSGSKVMLWRTAITSCRRHRGERSGAQFFAEAEDPLDFTTP